MNNREITGMCLLDIRKCFDTTNHDILLRKLHKYGIRYCELKWFESYLSNINQIVCYEGKISNTQTITIYIFILIVFTLFYNNIAFSTVCFIDVFTLFISVKFIVLMSLFYNNVAFITTFTLPCHPCTLEQSFD